MFEEVKEMIDSTIYTNGRGEVTAQNVNLAMQAIVEATEGKLVSLEENGLSSSGALRVWVYYDDISELTPEQVAENVETYKAICEGEHKAVVLCLSGSDDYTEAYYYTLTTTLTFAFKEHDDETYVVGIYFDNIDIIGGKKQLASVELSQDGSLEVHYWEEPSTPSGPLRVWVPIVAELTEEQKVENADTFAKLINGYAGLVYMIYQDVDIEVDANGVYTFIQLAKTYAVGTENDLRVAFLISDAVEIALLPDGTVEI